MTHVVSDLISVQGKRIKPGLRRHLALGRNRSIILDGENSRGDQTDIFLYTERTLKNDAPNSFGYQVSQTLPCGQTYNLHYKVIYFFDASFTRRFWWDFDYPQKFGAKKKPLCWIFRVLGFLMVKFLLLLELGRHGVCSGALLAGLNLREEGHSVCESFFKKLDPVVEHFL